MYWHIIDNCVLAFETGVLIFLAKHLFIEKRKQKGIIYLWIYVIIFLAAHKIIAVCLAGYVELIILCSCLTDFVLFGAVWPGQWCRRLFVIFFYYALMLTIDLLLIFAFPISSTDLYLEEYQLCSIIVSRILLFLFVLWVTTLGKSKSAWVVPLPALVFIMIVISRSGYEVHEVTFNQRLSLAVVVIFFIVLILLCAYIGLARNEIILQERLAIQEELRRQQEDYAAAALESYASIRQTRHDLHHYLETIATLIQSERYEWAVKICISASMRMGDTVIFTGNEIVDAVLYSKNMLFQKRGITISAEGLLPRQLNYDSADICIILANALENAAEAVVKLPVERRNVMVRFHFDDWLLIVVENEIRTLPKQKNGFFISSKPGADHGIGLDSIAAACERQNGYYEITVTDGRFTLSATMQPKSE